MKKFCNDGCQQPTDKGTIIDENSEFHPRTYSTTSIVPVRCSTMLIFLVVPSPIAKQSTFKK